MTASPRSVAHSPTPVPSDVPLEALSETGIRAVIAMDAVPARKEGGGTMPGLRAAHLFGLVDGESTVESILDLCDILGVCRMERHEALEVLGDLVRVGAIELRRRRR